MLSRSTDTYLRIQVKIQQVYNEVNQDNNQRQRHHAGLHHWEVQLPNSAYNEAAGTGDSKDRLSDHRTTEKHAELQTNHGDDRDSGILQRMFDNHHALLEAL